MEINEMLAPGAIALANIGAFGYLMKRTLDRIDRTDEKVDAQTILLARTAEVLEGLKHTIDDHNKKFDAAELNRHNHGKILAQIEALHELRGCKTIIQDIARKEGLRNGRD